MHLLAADPAYAANVFTFKNKFDRAHFNAL